MHFPGQGNNAYIFPGIALGTIASQSRCIEEKVFLIAAEVSNTFFLPTLKEYFLVFKSNNKA